MMDSARKKELENRASSQVASSFRVELLENIKMNQQKARVE